MLAYRRDRYLPCDKRWNTRRSQNEDCWAHSTLSPAAFQFRFDGAAYVGKTAADDTFLGSNIDEFQ